MCVGTAVWSGVCYGMEVDHCVGVFGSAVGEGRGLWPVGLEKGVTNWVRKYGLVVI